MPIRRIPGTDTDYYLVIFDEDGEETKESDGRLLSDALVLAAASATDVFLASHGWKGDVPAAIEQYDAWFGAALKLQEDRDAARRMRPRFKPLLVGLHWPSLPWGDEEVPEASTGDRRAYPVGAVVGAGIRLSRMLRGPAGCGSSWRGRDRARTHAGRDRHP